MDADRNYVLLERAISVICQEWGYTRERARAWLEEDSYGWTFEEVPQHDHPPGAFIQVKRTINIKLSNEK